MGTLVVIDTFWTERRGKTLDMQFNINFTQILY